MLSVSILTDQGITTALPPVVLQWDFQGYWLTVKINRIGFLFIIQGILSLTLKLLASIEHLLSAMCLTFLKTKPNSAFHTLDFSLFFSLLLCLPQVIIPPAFSAPASLELNEAEEKHSHAGCFGFKFMAVIFVGLLCCSITSDISLISSLSPLLVAC